ncbi:MAG: hypothetical protein ACRCU5_13880 [Rhizobiaceae bacterium]
MPLPAMHPYADASLDDLVALLGGADLQTLQRQALPSPKRDPSMPDDIVLRYAAVLYRQETGRQFINALFERTLLIDEPKTFPTFEATALASSKREALQGFGRVLLAMIAEGERLLTQPKDASYEKPD